MNNLIHLVETEKGIMYELLTHPNEDKILTLEKIQKEIIKECGKQLLSKELEVFGLPKRHSFWD